MLTDDEAYYLWAALPMARVDFAGAIVEASPPLCNVLGYPREELLGMTWYDITYPEDIGKGVSLSGSTIRNPLQARVIRKRYVAKNGLVIHATLATTVICDEQGEPDYWISTILPEGDAYVGRFNTITPPNGRPPE